MSDQRLSLMTTAASFSFQLRNKCNYNMPETYNCSYKNYEMTNTHDCKKWFHTIYDYIEPTAIIINFKNKCLSTTEMFNILGELKFMVDQKEIISVPIDLLSHLLNKKPAYSDDKFVIPLNTTYFIDKISICHIAPYNLLQWVVEPVLPSEINSIYLVAKVYMYKNYEMYVEQFNPFIQQINKYTFDELNYSTNHKFALDGYGYAKGYIVKYDILQLKNVKILLYNHIYFDYNVDMYIKLGILQVFGKNYLYIPINDGNKLKDTTLKSYRNGFYQSDIDKLEIEIELNYPSANPIIIYDVVLNVINLKNVLFELHFTTTISQNRPKNPIILPVSPLATAIKYELEDMCGGHA